MADALTDEDREPSGDAPPEGAMTTIFASNAIRAVSLELSQTATIHSDAGAAASPAQVVRTSGVEAAAVEGPATDLTDAELAAVTRSDNDGELTGDVVSDKGLLLTSLPEQPRSEVAYVPQISPSARVAYVAQVQTADAGQRMAVRSGGELLGNVQFQVAGGLVSVHIGQVLDLFEGRIDSARFAELRGSQAALEFVSLERLKSAGIPIEYNAAYDELTIGTVAG